MNQKTILIIGAGMGGLAAGIYGQLNGFRTQILEMHFIPGGQCTSWKRKGYTFDVCIHHLFGTSEYSRINRLWKELGAMPQNLIYPEECTAVVSPEGKMFRDYYDLEKLEQHLKDISPADSGTIKDYVNGIKSLSKKDYFGNFTFGSTADFIKVLPSMLTKMKWFKSTMRTFGERFTDPFMKKAFPLLVYSAPDLPVFIHLVRHAYGLNKSIAWPVGGALTLARSIEKHYLELGGEILYRRKVLKILTENNRATGVELADGTQLKADYVISDADGRKTILEMLEGRYLNETIKGYCAEPPDETNWAVHVFLGVNRDISKEPSSLIMLLDQPVTIAGHENRSLEMQLYGFDKTLAPEGKGVIKVELVSKHSYWKKLYEDKTRYEEEKQKVAEQVIEQIEKYFKGLREQIEVIDVPTTLTWERFMGGTHGFSNMPVKKASIASMLLSRKLENTLPGLENFYLAGVWVTSAGALFSNANSGKIAIQSLCKKEGQKFKVRK